MSGGSRGYIGGRIEDELCGQMYDAELNDLMADIAKLAHDVEWLDSGDYGQDTYKKSVAEFKKKWFKQPRTERLRGYVDEAITKLRTEMYALLAIEPPKEE
ncbi:MAG: hypothetical protein J6Y26_05385 [Lachnospiraceae bacterium]|nr:hypothetical protein [Lachnospiraceae bacterium]